MEFRQLSHFVAVAEEHSFTQAARRANIVQSGISASIGALERELGVTLFKRSKHRVELTDAGKALLVEARRALAAVAAARTAATSTDSSLTGTLAIGIVPTLPPGLPIPETLHQFRNAHPHVTISIRQYPVPTHFAVRDGEVELAIGPGYGPPGVTSVTLASYPLVLVCADSHRLAARRSVPIAALADESFVEPPVGWVSRRIADRAFADAGIERHTAVESNDVGMMLRLVRDSLGVAVLPSLVQELAPDLRCIPVRPQLGTWDLTISFLGHEPPSAVSRAYYKMLIERIERRARRQRTVRTATLALRS